MPRLTKVVCAMDDVAITQTMLVAMATLMGTPKARLSMGTMMMPPPTPSMLPKTPATTATARSAMTTPVAATSVVAGRGPPQTLDDGAALLDGEAPLHRRARGLRGPARRRRRRVELDELETQTAQRVHLVEVLAALRPARHREPVGPWRSRTALSVTFWCWPPGPPARKVSTSHSARRAASLSGMSRAGTCVWQRAGVGRRRQSLPPLVIASRHAPRLHRRSAQSQIPRPPRGLDTG